MASKQSLLVLLLLAAVGVHAGENHKQKWRFSWKERDGRIINDTICFNVTSSLSERLDCKRYARVWFRDECRRLESEKRNQGVKEEKRHALLRKKYCAVRVP